MYFSFPFLPPIETKSILNSVPLFSWKKRATIRRSFIDLEKKEDGKILQ
jgi:hypothetical protein